MEKCLICRKLLVPIDYGDGVICYDDFYEYHDYLSCAECFDKLVEWVDKNEGDW